MEKTFLQLGIYERWFPEWWISKNIESLKRKVNNNEEIITFQICIDSPNLCHHPPKSPRVVDFLSPGQDLPEVCQKNGGETSPQIKETAPKHKTTAPDDEYDSF